MAILMLPTASVDAMAEVTVDEGGVVTINLDRIDKGARVVLTYKFESGPDTDYPISMIGDDEEGRSG